MLEPRGGEAAVQVQEVRTARDPSGRGGRGKLTNLQVLRAVAALSVVLSHSGRWLWTSRGDDLYHVIFNDHLGTFGVVLFFAISGYLMSELTRWNDAGTFLVHRVVRIYPVFLIAAAIWAPARPLIGESARPDLMALTLAPVGLRDYPLGVEWTLVYEICFYIVVYAIVACGLRRRLVRIAVAWLVLLAVLALAGAGIAQAQPFPFIHAVLLKDANVAFAAGLILPSAIRRGLAPATLCVFGVPLAALGVWGEFEPLRWILAVPAILILALAIQAPQMPGTGAVRSTIVRLGDWSYALYLLHMPVLTLWYRLAPPEMSGTLLFWGSTAAAIGASVVLGGLDVGIYRRSRAAVDRMSSGTRSLAAAAFALAYVGLGVFAFMRHVLKSGGLG